MKKRRVRGWGRLTLWATGRFLLFFIIFIYGFIGLFVARSESSMFSASATATVIRSSEVKTSSLQSRTELVVIVVFAAKPNSTLIQTSIHPRQLKSVYRGQRLPVRYEPGVPINAIYDGPGGDFDQASYISDYVLAWFLIAVSAFPLLSGLLRLFRMLRASRATLETEAQIINGKAAASMARRMRVSDSIDGRALEWQLLRGQGKVIGSTWFIRGRLERGRWLVVRTTDNQLIWPATRAQPVIGTGTQYVWRTVYADLDIIAHHRLLAAYAQILGELSDLPFVIRCPPGQDSSSWWVVAPPRPLVEGFVTWHLRRRLGVLRAALMRAALLTGPDDDGTRRRTLREASQECQELADTLSRSIILTLLVPLVTIVLPIYVAFFPTPHVSFSKYFFLGVYFVWLVLGALSICISYRSVRCKQALFRPTIFDQTRARSDIPPFKVWDVYRFEEEAFRRAGDGEPRKPEVDLWIPRLLACIYGLAIVIPIIAGLGLLPFISLLLLLLATAAYLRISNIGFRRFMSSLRGFLARLMNTLDS